jgi:predicted lipid-binding transport protein (Tim44 family)
VPHLNKAGDLEKLRERALMREFEEYSESKQKRMKVFRLEAVRAGFKKAWRDYATIIAVVSARFRTRSSRKPLSCSCGTTMR